MSIEASARDMSNAKGGTVTKHSGPVRVQVVRELGQLDVLERGAGELEEETQLLTARRRLIVHDPPDAVRWLHGDRQDLPGA
eukprot:CAMPEP_0115515498 /NCGR_PEP_ID=MMETSP0271-20121206/76255_1 /TAXON_ID=71861 /ORGANISM="Scrippsiella trochoidea, Strain CCMP3099" /LENGTH=81 /DNA_ID=CAMNT_0002946087 /DNA_START=79 /DNA_END=323 /DNA_ORIENTATION=+